MSVLFHIDGLILLAVLKSKEKLTNARLVTQSDMKKPEEKKTPAAAAPSSYLFFGFLFRRCYTSRQIERENNRKMRWNSSKTPAA